MVRSMTAFSRLEKSGEFGELSLELRSVNHRYLEISMRLPEAVRSLEPKLRARIAARLARGKVDVNLRIQAPEAGEDALIVDMELVKQLSHISREVDKVLYDAAPVSSLELLRWPGVLQPPALDTEALQAAVLTLLDEGLDELLQTREREGEKLAAAIEQRCRSMEEVVAKTRQQMPAIMQAWRDKLVARLEQVRAELDENRLEQEMVYLAQKTDVEEELDRLDVHLAEVRRVLKEDKPIGRRLDFLMQELNREANTLGSKSIHTDTTRASVDLKVFIEQMREQVQNIE